MELGKSLSTVSSFLFAIDEKKVNIFTFSYWKGQKDTFWYSNKPPILLAYILWFFLPGLFLSNFHTVNEYLFVQSNGSDTRND